MRGNRSGEVEISTPAGDNGPIDTGLLIHASEPAPPVDQRFSLLDKFSANDATDEDDMVARLDVRFDLAFEV